MRGDKPSSTAAMVAAARALVDDVGTMESFADQYARDLLPDLYRRGISTVGLGSLLMPAARHFALRTVAIDEGIRRAPALEQLVILGAGLDARAWRLPELVDVPVFEVDHPSTQRYKKERLDEWNVRSDHEFVAVDFQRDALDDELQSAGHDPNRATVWIWEGVTMYLESSAIDATLATLASRSAPRSRLLVTYVTPSLAFAAIGLATWLFGEPLRSASTPAEMQKRLTRHGFGVERDESGMDWRTRWAPDGIHLPGFVSRAERLATADYTTESS